MATPTGGDKLRPDVRAGQIGVWSINNDEDVPPRWFFGGPSSGFKTSPRTVVLNPKTEELIVGDTPLNAVLTFYFPELL